MAKKIGVMLCGHGSRDDQAIQEFAHFVQEFAKIQPEYPISSGFLEFAQPVIRQGLEALKESGVNHIIALPIMLFAAGHVKNDIPSVLQEFAAQHPEIQLDFGRDLALDPQLLQAASERIIEAEEKATQHIDRHETLLLVIGRGTSDPDANSNIAKIARMLWEGMGFGWAEVGYSGVTYPLVDEALHHAARLGYRRVIVFPYFLFTGILIDRIYEATDRAIADYPEIEFIKAPYLNDHPLVLQSFKNRVQETLHGQNAMNCLLCKYREAIIGYEEDKGAPQQGHHHHVEGIGTNSDHGHTHQQGKTGQLKQPIIYNRLSAKN